MRKYWSKNLAIVVLLTTNTLMVAYIVNQKFGIMDRFAKLMSHEPMPAPSKTIAGTKHGEILPAMFASNQDNELQGCYEALLSRGPASQEGIVQVHMTIDKSGAIDTLKLVHSDLPDSDFQSCVMSTVKASHVIVTPERIGAIISHRFHFHKKALHEVSFEN